MTIEKSFSDGDILIAIEAIGVAVAVAVLLKRGLIVILAVVVTDNTAPPRKFRLFRNDHLIIFPMGRR